MFANVKSAWGFVGVGLFLVAMYLVLTNGTNAAKVINAAGANLAGIYKTLQGR